MKSQKLGAILTVASTPEGVATVAGYTKSAASVFVLTNLPLPNAFGLFNVKPRKTEPSLREALIHHMGKIRGKETIGILLPPTTLPVDFSVLQHSLGSNRMELSWAFHARAKFGVLQPDLIILTTSLIPHIIHNLKDDIPFEGTSWSRWLHEWCLKTMPSHKYIDISDGLGLPEIQPMPWDHLPTGPADPEWPSVGLESLDNGTASPHPDEVAPLEQKAVKAKRTANKRKSKKS